MDALTFSGIIYYYSSVSMLIINAFQNGFMILPTYISRNFSKGTEMLTVVYYKMAILRIPRYRIMLLSVYNDCT